MKTEFLLPLKGKDVFQAPLYKVFQIAHKKILFCMGGSLPLVANFAKLFCCPVS